MSTPPYKPQEFISIDEALQYVGYTETQAKQLNAQDRAQYLNWVRQANNLVETSLSNFVDVLPFEAGSKEITYAKQAALDWVMYKKRDMAGSLNARNAKSDHEGNIASMIKELQKRPTDRTYPIGVERTNSLEDYMIPYSQTQGFPPDLLY